MSGFEADGKRQEMASDATIRDYFAVQAMQAMISGGMASGSVLREANFKLICETAYAVADEMLKQRSH